MKRWVILGVLVVGLTMAATVAVPYLPGTTGSHPSFPMTPPDSAGPRGKAVVDGDLKHEFGVMAQQTKGRRAWMVRNEGPGELTLRKGPSTCSCTIASLKEGDKHVLGPGEETEIVLEWETRTNNGKFSKSASIITDDPAKPQLDFIVEGEVRPAVVTFPLDQTVNLLNVSNEATTTAFVAISSPDRPEMAIKEVVSSRPEFLTAEVGPLSEEMISEFGMKTGHTVRLELKPGMPLGAFREEVLIKTDHPAQPEVPITVAGTMTGPISVLPERVRLSQVPGRQGGRAELTLWVRGRSETDFRVAQAPEKLKVDIARLDNSVEGTGRYRMTVTVPPGTAAGTINGTIVLDTDHPLASQVKIPVNILVLNAG